MVIQRAYLQRRREAANTGEGPRQPAGLSLNRWSARGSGQSAVQAKAVALMEVAPNQRSRARNNAGVVAAGRPLNSGGEDRSAGRFG